MTLTVTVQEMNCHKCHTRWDVDVAPRYCPDCGTMTSAIKTYRFDAGAQ